MASHVRGFFILVVASVALCGALIPGPHTAAHAQESARGAGAPVDGAPLSLEEVLDTIYARHPLALAALQKQRAAEAKRRSAQGAFDTQLTGSGEVNPVGTYVYSALDLTLVQPTTLWGLRLFGGWHNSLGELPSYKDQWYHKVDKDFTGYKSTPDPGTAGKLYAGAALPLLRGGAIDKERAAIASAQVMIEQATAELDVKLLELEGKAAEAYWGWVAAGQQRQVALDLLETATRRQEQIKRKIEGGQDPPIYLIENERYVLKRQRKVIEAEQKLGEASVKLSQYWRPQDDASPARPADSSLPNTWPPVDFPTQEAATQAALEAAQEQPRWRSLDALRDAARVDQRLYTNELLPRLDLTAAVAQPLDVSKSGDMRVVLGAASPIQRRYARGAMDAAEAEIVRIEAELRALQDQVEADAAEAWIALSGARQRVALTERELEIALQLEAAERTLFENGASTLLIVNLREQDTADAAMALVDARRDLQLANARFILSLGRSLRTPPPN